MIPRTKLYHDGVGFIYLTAPIGRGADSISADDFAQAHYKLRRCDRGVLICDCPGGEIEHSAQITDIWRNSPFERHALIAGRAHSAALDPIMACSWREAIAGSTMMLHRCNALDMETADADAASRSAEYSARTWAGTYVGCTCEMIEKWLDVGTWFSDAEMLKAGFVHRIVQPNDALPLLTSVDISECNRPMFMAPYVDYRRLECPVYDSHYGQVSNAVRYPKRQPIEIPAIPVSLRGRMICCAADVADVKARLTTAVSRGPTDPRAVVEAQNARALLGMHEEFQKREAAAMARAMAAKGV